MNWMKNYAGLFGFNLNVSAQSPSFHPIPYIRSNFLSCPCWPTERLIVYWNNSIWMLKIPFLKISQCDKKNDANYTVLTLSVCDWSKTDLMAKTGVPNIWMKNYKKDRMKKTICLRKMCQLSVTNKLLIIKKTNKQTSFMRSHKSALLLRNLEPINCQLSQMNKS